MSVDLNNGYSAVKGDKQRDKRPSASQRMSPYYFLTTSSHSSQGSNYSPPMPPHNVYTTPNYYYPTADYPAPMWHMNRYKEDELPNVSSNLAAALYHPRHQMAQQSQQPQMHNRRFSVASIPTSNANPYSQPPQRRRISVSKFQNIPPANFLQVPSFHQVDLPTCDYEDERTIAPTHSKHSTAVPNSQRKASSGCIPKNRRSRRSRSLSQSSSRSQSPSNVNASGSRTRSRSPSLDRHSMTDPTSIPVPAFEFTSNHLPLRAPVEDNIKFSSGGSGSTSTPESQRIESRQMIRSTKGGGERNIFYNTKPGLCQHSEDKTCKNCKNSDARSQCSSVNPPPTFTKMDNYQPVRKKSSRFNCSCGAVFCISIIFAVIVMVFIASFILYVELVLKHQTANVMDKM